MAEDRVSRTIAKHAMTLVLICFFFSGLTGLIYEILWTRMIVKIIGGAPFAVSIILTVFMAGLGLGSYLAGRFIDRVKEPVKLVRIYGLVELAIGAYGLVLPILLAALRPLYGILYNHLFSHFLPYSFVTFVGCAAVLLFPVVCMGATLPILCRFYVTSLSHLGTHAGRLYGLNTIGAAFGALLCGFWLISLLGVWGTLILAVVVNTVIGFSCILVGYKARPGRDAGGGALFHPEESRPKDAPEAAENLQYPGAETGALAIFAVSGFCAMAYEVMWTKLLGLIVGPTTYSFTIVLVTFILGLALGSMIFGRLADRTGRAIWLLIFTQVAAALSVLGVSQILGNSQLFFAKVIFHFKDQFVLLSLVKGTILFALMILPTLCLGATFPLVGKITTRSVSRVGKSIGFAYAINTMGAVSGSFCAGFVLIPLVGKENGLSMVIGLQLLTSLIVAGIVLFKSGKAAWKLVPLAVPALAGLVLSIHFPQWNHSLLARGKYHRFGEIEETVRTSGWLQALLAGPEILTRSERGELVYYGEGIGGFTTVQKYTGPLGDARYVLLNSGKADASSKGDMETQTLSAHFPMLFHRDPGTVMVLGLASGITAGEVLYYPVERLDIVDINEQVVKASDFFIPWNHNVLSDPRTNLIIQDGRAHLNLTVRKYDVIISEPSNPWMAGLASLFTRDFFALAKDRLNDDGLFVQFMHSYQMDWATFALVGRTFSQVFPNSLLAVTSPSTLGTDYLLVGFKGKDRLILDHANRKISHARKSKNISLSDPRLLYRLIVSEDLQGLFGRGPVNTDNRPLLEFAAPRLIYHDDPTIRRNILSGKRINRGTRDIVREVTSDLDAQIEFAAFALSVHEPFENMVDLTKASPSQKARLVSLVETYCADNALDASVFGDEALTRRCRSAQIETIEARIDRLPDKALSYSYLADLCIAEGLLDRAIAGYSRSVEIEPENAVAHNSLGAALGRQGWVDKAVMHFKVALRIDPGYAKAHNNIGYALMRQGELEKAIAQFRKALKIDPGLAEAHKNLGSVLARLGRLDESVKEYQEALRMDPDNPKVKHELGVVLSRQGKIEEAERLFAGAGQEEHGAAERYPDLGRTLFRQGKFEEAEEAYRRAVEMTPGSADIHNELGFLLARQGRLDEAAVHIEKALQINPGLAAAQFNLGGIFLRQDKTEEAVVHFEKALEIKPDLVEAHITMGKILFGQGRFDKAAAHFKEALKVRPDLADVQADLGRILLRQGSLEEAATHLKEALRLEPDRVEAINNLAWILATHQDERVREPEEAIRLAERASELTRYKSPQILDTLAVAYAAAGKFLRAAETAETAMELARSSGQGRLAEEIRSHLIRFKAAQPYGESPP